MRNSKERETWGGPDLFLAPVGRIDAQQISKFFCNTCEKDYEGGPKIEFENPNEEVAENLILAEKGQYICTTCGSAIAEYRDFKKSDELQDVGNARPQTPEPSPMQDLPPAPTPEPTVTIPDFGIPAPTTTVQEDIISESQQTGQSYSSIIGMVVYDENAKKIGTVNQIGVDSTQSVVLIISKPDGRQINVNWNQIKKIGEVVLLGTGGLQQGTLTSNLKCTNCGFENKMDSKFCESCGNKI